MFKKLFLFSLFLSFFGFVVNAQINPMNLPKLTQYVSDFADVLDVQTLNKLNVSAQLYDAQTANQLLVVLIPNRNGIELFDIGMKIFNENAIGQVAKNNGILLLISTQEKKIRIIVGYGLESQMPDLLASRIIEEDIRPFVNNGDFSGAVGAFYARARRAIDTNESQTIPASVPQNNSENFWLIGLILGFIFTLILKKPGLTKKGFAIYLSIFIILILLGLAIWLSITIFLGFLAGIFFAFTGIIPGRGGFGGGGISFGGSGGFSGGGGSSGGGGAGD